MRTDPTPGSGTDPSVPARAADDPSDAAADVLAPLRHPHPTAVPWPPPWLGLDGRIPGRGAVVVVAVVVLAVGAVVTLVVRSAWAGDAGPTPVPPDRGVAASAPDAATQVGPAHPAATGPDDAPGTSSPVPAPVVHVAGAVVRAGVHHLRPGDRVADAVEAAGGPAADADLARVNLAAPVADGTRVYVPRVGEDQAPPMVDGPAPPAGAPGTTRPASVDLNRATAAELDALPGIGPATADAIIGHRQAHGRFVTVDDLTKVRGIGPAKLAQLRPLVRV